MDIKVKYYKLKLCDEYIKNKKCDKGDKCTYAHGEKEIREMKKTCNYGLNCFNESCIFEHPKTWNPKDNKKICNYGLNCFNDNCNFKHIDENTDLNENNKINNKDNKIVNGVDENKNLNTETNIKLDINKDFPDLNENIKINNKIKDDNIVNGVDENSKNKELLPNIEIIVNDMKYNDTDNMLNTNKSNITVTNNNIINESGSIEDINNDIQIPLELKEMSDIEELIINMQKIFEKYTMEIKNNIDTVFINDKQKYGIDMKIQLNKIMYEVSLFKLNYHDFNKYNNKI